MTYKVTFQKETGMDPITISRDEWVIKNNFIHFQNYDKKRDIISEVVIYATNVVLSVEKE